MIYTKDICQSLNKNVILSNVSFELSNGCIVGLLGKNGSGKTTLLKILSNLQKPSSGEAYINSFNVKEWSKLHTNVGVALTPSIPGYLKVREYLKEVAIIKGSSPEDLDKVINIMELEKKLNTKIKNLSFGQKQRVNIAAAMINDPNTLLLDEPFVGLDPIGMEKLNSYLLQKKKRDP